MRQFYHLLKITVKGQEFKFQTCSPTHSVEFCGELFTDFLCANIPFTSSGVGSSNGVKITIPIFSSKTYSQLTLDFIIDNNYLKGALVEIATLDNFDPNYIMGFVPWLIDKPQINEIVISFDLQTPTRLTGDASKLMSRYFTDQLIPEMPRTF